MSNVNLGIGCSAPTWVRDEDVDKCMSCSFLFNLTRRRHHCRACGKIFCNPCSNRRAYINYLKKKARICLSCFKLIYKTTKNTLDNNQVFSNMVMDAKAKYILPPIIIYESGGTAGNNIRKIVNLPLHLILTNLKNEDLPPISFVINANLVIIMKALFLPFVGRLCWFYKSVGLRLVGQDEIVFAIESKSPEECLPLFPFLFFQRIYKEASFGERYSHLSYLVLDSSHLEALFFIRCDSELINLKGFSLPERPFLISTLVIGPDIWWAKFMPSRLAYRLSTFTQYFPVPLVTFLARDPVFSQIKNSMILPNTFSENINNHLLPIPGLTITLQLNFEGCLKFSSLIKLQNENSHVHNVSFDCKTVDNNSSNNLPNKDFNKTKKNETNFICNSGKNDQGIGSSKFTDHDSIGKEYIVNKSYESRNVYNSLYEDLENRFESIKESESTATSMSQDLTLNWQNESQNSSEFIHSLIEELVIDIADGNASSTDNFGSKITIDSSQYISVEFMNSLSEFENGFTDNKVAKATASGDIHLLHSTPKIKGDLNDERLCGPISSSANYISLDSKTQNFYVCRQQINSAPYFTTNNSNMISDNDPLIRNNDLNTISKYNKILKNNNSIMMVNSDDTEPASSLNAKMECTGFLDLEYVESTNLPSRATRIKLVIPRLMYKQVMRILQSSSDMITFAASYDKDADGHLVCFQDSQAEAFDLQIHGDYHLGTKLSPAFIQFRNNSYKLFKENNLSTFISTNVTTNSKPSTINISNASSTKLSIATNDLPSSQSWNAMTYANTTANLLTTPSSSSSTTFWSIVEDAIVISASPHHMDRVREALYNMTMDDLVCGNGDVISIVWAKDFNGKFNGDQVSVIDGTDLSNVESFRPFVTSSEGGVRFFERESKRLYDVTEFIKNNSFVRCTDVFFWN